MIEHLKNRVYKTITSNSLNSLVGFIAQSSHCLSSTSNVIKIVCFSALILSAGCKEKYEVPLKTSETNYLVVDGFINANGFTNITLRRTVPLKDTAKLKAETNAVVTIAGEDNSVYTVREKGNGSYISDSLVLNTNQKYRLHIKTTSRGEYLSEYVAVKQTPPIDSVSWALENDGVHINVSTHDPKNNARYYKWDYEETWEIHSPFVANFKYLNGSVLPTSLDEQQNMFYCWRNQNSSVILVGSTVQLANDVVEKARILFIPNQSEKTSVRYSILVKQYSLDKNGYDFYKMMKSNTESLGSVFDPLPSEITGNITCISNPLEKVIGYVSASVVKEKRIFILSNEVQSTYSNPCETISVPNNVDSFKVYYGVRGYKPYQQDPPPLNPPKVYFSSTGECVDCRLRGSSVKPSFW